MTEKSVEFAIFDTYLFKPSRFKMPISPKKSPAFIVVSTLPVSDITSKMPSAIMNISRATSPVGNNLIFTNQIPTWTQVRSKQENFINEMCFPFAFFRLTLLWKKENCQCNRIRMYSLIYLFGILNLRV